MQGQVVRIHLEAPAGGTPFVSFSFSSGGKCTLTNSPDRPHQPLKGYCLVLATGQRSRCSGATEAFFAATLTVTLYAVTDMEYPRLGLVRIENFDHFLVDAHQQMQPRER